MKRLWQEIIAFFDDLEDHANPGYDPVHVAAMLVAVIFGIALLFWLLWALLVFGGGIQAKIIPFLLVVFTARTTRDFGYVGYPYEMGVFEGWVTNVVALALVMAVITAIWYVFEIKDDAGQKTTATQDAGHRMQD